MNLLHAQTGALLAPAPPAGLPLRRPRAVARTAASAALAAGVASALAVASAAALGVRPHVEVSDSMRPELRAGDVVWLRDVAARDVARGDVVAFARGDDAILHRVVALEARGGGLAVVTRGDANTGVERWSIRRDATLGRYAGVRVPHAGRAVRALAGPPLAILSGLSGIALAVLLVRRIWR